MSDFDQIVESYLPAAAVMGMNRADVEQAVRAAVRIERRCASCRFGRAPHSVFQLARVLGVLDIFNRRCADRLPQRVCAYWEPLELPPAVIVPATAEEVL